MSVVPGGVDPETGPPTRLSLAHFLLGLVLLVAATALGAVGGAGATLARTHLLVAGWVCVTIMGAMTQFVPVWGGVELYSQRLAVAQVALFVPGVVGLAVALLAGRPAWLPLAGAVVALGLWTFVGNVGLTLAAARPLDVTERHFAAALAFLALVPLFGLGLGLDRSGVTAIGRSVGGGLAGAHATLAVFGGVLTTVAGALYQLATMFTGTDLDPLDRRLQRAETATYPLGVVALAGGRLVGSAALARVGGVLVAGGLFAVGIVLSRRLHAVTVERTPMHSRYAVVAAATLGWSPLALSAWLHAPLTARFGGPVARPLLLVGVVGVVVLGTLYHVVPFLVWVTRYSDRLGLEQVPGVDDLYDDRLAALDFWLVCGGLGALVGARALGLPPVAETVGWVAVLAGAGVVTLNLLLVVGRHADTCPAARLVGLLPTTGGQGTETTDAGDD